MASPKQPLGRVPPGDACGQWIPVFVAAIDKATIERRPKHGPASWQDARAFTWVNLQRGVHLSGAAVAGWAGWAPKQGVALLSAVRAEMQAWAESYGAKKVSGAVVAFDVDQGGESSGAPKANDTIGLQGEVAQEWRGSGAVVAQELRLVRASLLSTGTSTPTSTVETADPSPPKKAKKRAKTIASPEAVALWSQLMEVRHQHRPGAGATLSINPKMGRDLDDALTWATPPQILHAYDWWMRSAECQWWRDRPKIDIDTFTRPSKLGGFVRSASEWDHATEQAEIRRVELERESCPF